VLDVPLRWFMRAWCRSRESALVAVPFPADAPVHRVAGPAPIRLLLVGNGAASGWGVRSHELALPGRLAGAVADRTGRGVQVDARVDRIRRISDLAGLLGDHDLERCDAVVLIAGMNDAVHLTPLDEWERAVRGLLDRFGLDAPGAGVLVLGPQPVQSVSTYTGWPGAVADRHRRRMNRITASICADRGVSFAVLDAPRLPPGEPGHRAPEVYTEWAATIAGLLAPVLRSARRVGNAPQPEPERQQATAAMLPDAPRDPRLDRITELARTAFGVEFAALSLLDGEWQVNRSIAGGDLARSPRASSMCDHTIRSDLPLVIPDLSEDRRFDGNPAVHGRAHLRFYAGYPIESPDGYRVGAFCILDTEPRDVAEIDTAALSELALLAQKELWASVGRGGPGEEPLTASA
jgi:hypothetical protein